VIEPVSPLAVVELTVAVSCKVICPELLTVDWLSVVVVTALLTVKFTVVALLA
jgi:hypothetical protein